MNICSFDFPDDMFYLVEHQVWARLEDKNTASVGITAMGIRAAGEIYMCRPKAVGAVVEQERSIAVVELAKSIVSVKSPVRGTIVQINQRLAQNPELVHLDPYGEGWLAHVALDDWPADLHLLLHGSPVVRAMEQYARQNRLESM